MQKSNNVHTENKRIILNWMPPASVYWPSPAMSVLKSYLVKHGFEVDIDYWNLRLRQINEEFIGRHQDFADKAAHLYLLFNYLAIKCQDINAYNIFKVQLKAMRPNFTNVSDTYYDEQMQMYAEKVESILDSVIMSYDFNNILYIGFEAKLYQWICSSIIAKKIKGLSPTACTVIGGFGTKQSAVAFLENFPQFDFAMWGEGEISLLKLSKIIKNKEYDFVEQVSNIAYRKDNCIQTSINRTNYFVDLSDECLKPKYEDYFLQVNSTNFSCKELRIPIEGSRSCHWKKCHFCYLNTGYKFRTKNVKSIITELEDGINKYGITKLMFLDNDLVANDINRFESILDEMIRLKDKYPTLTVMSAEIITHGLNADIIRKMALAGFKYVQIGYESASDALLQKINKKNTFSSNLLFIKFAQKYKIALEGVNIIRFLYEETDKDVIEVINNLHFIRFFYRGGFFKHDVSDLAVTESSPYYHKFGVKDSSLVIDYIAAYLPKAYVSNHLKPYLYEYTRFIYNILWDKFDVLENYYRSHQYDYSLIRLNDKIFYYEYLDETLINSLEFDDNSLDWYLLNIINESVLSVDEIYNMCKISFNVEQESIMHALKGLSEERLIYHTPDFSENIAIIDVRLVK